MVARLVANWVPDEEATASLCRRTPHLRVVLAQIWQNTVTHKLVEYVT